MRTLPTDGLLLQPRLQMRAALDTETIEEYAAAMQTGEPFPPVRVVEADDGWLVCDGFHRVSAARAAGVTALPCNVTPGTFDDALLLALAANATNGLRRSNADKRRAVTVALERWPEKSDRVIAQLCGVDHKMVAPLRPQLGDSPSSPVEPEKRIGADGKARTVPAKPNDSAANPANTKVRSAEETPQQCEKPTPKPAEPVTSSPQEADDDGAPSDEEIAAFQAQDAADRAMLEKVLTSDQPMAAAHAEIKRLNAENAVLRGQRDQYMNKCNELIRQVKALKREANRTA